MVTPVNGTLTLKGQSGKIYSVSIYLSDVIGAACTFNYDGLAVAGSQVFINAPENVVISDLTTHTGPTVAVALQPQVNDRSMGVIIPFVTVLDTLAFRSVPQIGFVAGAKIGLKQL